MVPVRVPVPLEVTWPMLPTASEPSNPLVKNPYTPLNVALVQVAAEADPTVAIIVNIMMATPETTELKAVLKAVLLELVLQNCIFPPLCVHGNY
jgi:hypothetical protein